MRRIAEMSLISRPTDLPERSKELVELWNELRILKAELAEQRSMIDAALAGKETKVTPPRLATAVGTPTVAAPGSPSCASPEN